MNWKWAKGAATLKEDFGDRWRPRTTCFASTTEAGNTHAEACCRDSAGGTCDSGRPCWKDTARGFKYSNKAATPDGIVSLTLKEGFEAARRSP